METLYEYLKNIQTDIDTYDNTFEGIITCCYITDEEFDKEILKTKENKNYYRFVKTIYQSVKLVREDAHIFDWAGFVKQNEKALKKFMADFWYNDYKGDDFVYQWIRKLHNWLAGYSTEKMYYIFLDYLTRYGKGAIMQPKNNSNLLALAYILRTGWNKADATFRIVEVSESYEYLSKKMDELISNNSEFKKHGINYENIDSFYTETKPTEGSKLPDLCYKICLVDSCLGG